MGVDTGIMTFVNHGCNSSYNTGTHTVENEMTANSGSGPGAIYSDLRPIYNPRVARHFPLENDDVPTSLLDIDAGEELLDNYLPFGGSERLDLWESNLRLLKSICSGGTGVIFQYEHKERIGTFCPLHALSLDSSST